MSICSPGPNELRARKLQFFNLKTLARFRSFWHDAIRPDRDPDVDCSFCHSAKSNRAAEAESAVIPVVI